MNQIYHEIFTIRDFNGAVFGNLPLNENPNSAIPLETVLEELQAAASIAFNQAHPIPACVNHSREFLDHEINSVFSAEWICVGREDELAKHGDFLTLDIGGTPVLVVRKENGDLGAYVNACAHRFACLVPADKGYAKRFTCRYHAWTYDCDGKLIRAPYMEMKENFKLTDHRLRPLHSATWEGFVYVTLAENPHTELNDVLRPFTDNIVGRYDMGGYQTVLRESMSWAANWKNLVENFVESYHVPIAHGKTFAQHEKPLDEYVCGEDSEHYCYHYAAQHAESGPGAAHARNLRLDGPWRRTMVDFCVFPCHLVTLMPDYLWYITVQPDGVDRMSVVWGVAVPAEILDDVADTGYDSWLENFKTYMDTANSEDKVLVEALHRGSSSPLLPRGTYHPIERNLWQFARYLARVCCK